MGPLIAANGEFIECATEWNPGGTFVMTSPCDIHTSISPGSLSKMPARSSMLIDAWPYSRRTAALTAPPSWWASSCMP